MNASIRDAIRQQRERVLVLDGLVDTLRLSADEDAVVVVVRERDRAADHLRNLISLVEGECAFTGEPLDV